MRSIEHTLTSCITRLVALVAAEIGGTNSIKPLINTYLPTNLVQVKSFFCRCFSTSSISPNGSFIFFAW